MKAIIEFNLPEQQPEYDIHCQASKMFAVLWDFDQWLRSQIKHGNRDELQEIRDKLHEFINEEGVNLE